MDTAISWALVGLPSVIYFGFAVSYFLVGRGRREHVERLLGVPTVRSFYVKAYRLDGGSERSMVDKMIPRWTQHVVPLVLCGLVTLPVSVVGASVAGLPLGLPEAIARVASAAPVAVLAGFAGAYLWGLVACIDRFRVVNLTPSFVHGLWVRLLVGGVLGGLVGVPFKAEYAPLLAFSLGVFPSITLRKWLRRRAAKTVGLEDDGEGAGPGWSVIEGITPELVDRLEEADVSSPTALANADPFRLFLDTNVAWRHILDLIDQAILAGYVGAKLAAARPKGVRGAIEMAILGERRNLLRPDNPVRQDAERTITELSRALDQPEEATRTLIQNLVEDAQVELVWNLWYEEPARGVVYPPAGDRPPQPASAA